MPATGITQAKSDAPDLIIRYEPRGAARSLFTCHAPEVVLSGPAGTGKTRGGLELLHLRAALYPGSRHLMLRKTYASLKASAMVTFDEQVKPDLDGVIFRGDTAKRPPSYNYPNGSVIVVGGLDKATKIMSSEYDTIYVPEATELSEGEWEALNTRLRYGKLPYQQLYGDVNPDAPGHWMKQRAGAAKLLMLESRHEDNPRLWDGNQWTAEGVRYMAVLDALSGVRYLRLRLGVWAAAEGMVYQDSWDRARNLIERSAVTGRSGYSSLYGDCQIPRQWARYLAIDFGYTNPFVCQWWAQDPDGRLYLYREIFATHKLVEDHAAAILHFAKWRLESGRLTPSGKDSDPLPRAIFCDHDAEGRATLERHLGWYTTPADKAIQAGIQSVAARMKPAGDGKPRLFVLRDSLVERDPLLGESKLPASTVEEVEGYVWDTRGGRAKGEEPLDANNHGMDAMRYVCHTLDRRPTEIAVSTFKVF